MDEQTSNGTETVNTTEEVEIHTSTEQTEASKTKDSEEDDELNDLLDSM